MFPDRDLTKLFSERIHPEADRSRFRNSQSNIMQSSRSLVEELGIELSKDTTRRTTELAILATSQKQCRD